jgi:hypothetical protein
VGRVAVGEMMSLQEWHERNHFWGYRVPCEHCWFCQRNEAVCKSKVAYTDARVAHEQALAIQEAERWGRIAAPYRCRVCGAWHLTSKPTKARRSRLEKQRRKALRREAD